MRARKKERHGSINYVTETECEHCGHVVVKDEVSDPLFYKLLPKQKCPACRKRGRDEVTA